MKLKIYILAFAFSLFTSAFAQNTNPVVSNVAFTISGTTVTVTYDVTDAEQSTVTIQMEVSNNGGATYDYNYGTATGDIGANKTTGTNKTITWQYSGNNTDIFKIKIIADDLVGDQIYYAGQIYNTVTIGTQTWLKENLNVGTKINGTNNQISGNGIEKYCYDNNEANCTQYGGLYQWDEAMQYVTTEGTQGICPSGWHIPTYAEFQTLTTFVGNSSSALKAVGQGDGTNSSGFSAVLAGFRNFNNGLYGDKDIWAFFWSSKQDGGNAHNLYFPSSNWTDLIDSDNKLFGLSVRCLKD